MSVSTNWTSTQIIHTYRQSFLALDFPFLLESCFIHLILKQYRLFILIRRYLYHCPFYLISNQLNLVSIIEVILIIILCFQYHQDIDFIITIWILPIPSDPITIYLKYLIELVIFY